MMTNKSINLIMVLSLIAVYFLSVTVIVSAESVVYQNRDVDKDSYVDEYYPNSFEPWGQTIIVSTGNDYPADGRALIKFDLSTLPDNINIESASLSLYTVSWGENPSGRTYSVYPLNRNWIDGQDTWNSYSTGNLWTNPGGDYNVTPSASAIVPGLTTWMTWDVTQIVKNANAGSTDFSVVIKDSVEGQPRAETRFASNEDTMWAGYEPKLTITYSVLPVCPSIYPTSTIPTINIVYPNGGEYWNSGTAQVIVWSSENIGDNVKIELLESGKFSMNIVSSTENVGYYIWKIPRNIKNSGKYSVKVSSINILPLFDKSDAYFVIKR